MLMSLIKTDRPLRAFLLGWTDPHRRRAPGCQTYCLLAARDVARMEALAGRLRRRPVFGIDVVKADLTDARDLARVEARLRDDKAIGLLVNNAGTTAPAASRAGPRRAGEADPAEHHRGHAACRRGRAALPCARGSGAIVNISSALALAPEISFSIYGATKAFVLMLSQSMQNEIGPRGVYVQARAAGSDAYRDLAACGTRRERDPRRDRGRRARRRRAGRLRRARGGDEPIPPGCPPVGEPSAAQQAIGAELPPGARGSTLPRCIGRGVAGRGG